MTTVDASPFVRRRTDRFHLPRRFGEIMASLDEPAFADAFRAGHMRPDDIVIGITSPTTRAYPVWIVDHYHVVNDEAAGVRFLVASCERCQSGAAFLADAPGPDARPPLFRAAGVAEAALTLTDVRTASVWNHIDGRAIRGRAAGTSLAFLPALQMEWADWVALHPETQVLVPPDDARHPDARHGHGREEFFGRPGIDPLFVPTITGPFDASLPENEVVLAVETRDGWNAYPLRDVQRAGGVCASSDADGRFVVVAGPRSDGFTMAAYRTRIDGTGDEVELARRDDGTFEDARSASAFAIDGTCVSGPLTGRALAPLRFGTARWHAWFYPHRDSIRLCRPTAAPPPRVAGAIGDVVERLSARRAGEVAIEGSVVSQQRPRGARSVELRVDGCRMRLHVFEHGAGARDFTAFDGAWACDPFAARIGAAPCARLGSVVVQADPERRFADAAQLVPIPDDQVAWGPVTEIIDGVELPPALLRPPEGPPAFVDVLRELRSLGVEALDPGFLPRHQLRPGADDGIGLTLEGDRFLLYRFSSVEDSRVAAQTIGHAVAGGLFVARSSPDSMYEHREYEIGYAGDDRIRWSVLLEDDRIAGALGEATARAA
jgi:hypothetical protein